MPDYSSMINDIEMLPGNVEAAVRGLNDTQLDTPYREGGWTVRQVVHHLADSHMNAFIRMKLALTEDNPLVKPYDQDSWACQPDVLGVPLERSLQLLRGLHARWTLLFRALPPEAWKRTFNHPEHGPVTLESFLKTYSGHCRKHLEHINSLKRAKGW